MLSKKIQKHFHELQNPADCSQAKKIVCDLNKACGFGCQMHHVMYCFITAFFTKRTMILDSDSWRYNGKGIETYYKPISDTCRESMDPSVNWNGKFIKIIKHKTFIL
jgi:glycoprotein 6-alpha-L-fucosyltransferase